MKGGPDTYSKSIILFEIRGSRKNYRRNFPSRYRLLYHIRDNSTLWSWYNGCNMWVIFRQTMHSVSKKWQHALHFLCATPWQHTDYFCACKMSHKEVSDMLSRKHNTFTHNSFGIGSSHDWNHHKIHVLTLIYILTIFHKYASTLRCHKH
jgi:hypothetical protein